MNELGEIRRRKLEELQRAQQQRVEEDVQVQQQIQQLEIMIKQVMTKDALERYGNIKTADPDKAVQLLAILGQLIQAGKLTKIDDKIFKEILMELTPKKKEFKITRK